VGLFPVAQARFADNQHQLAFALARALAINDRHQRITGDPRRAENPMGAVLLERVEAAS